MSTIFVDKIKNNAGGATVQVDEIVNASGDNDSGIDLSTNDQIDIKTADTERMRIDSSGNVGIGTTSISNGKLVVSGSNGTIGGVSGLATFAKGSTGGGAIESGCNTAAIQAGSDGTNGFISTGSNDMRFLTSGGERMRIDSGGEVGIGETSPSALLHLKSAGPNIKLEDSDNDSDYEIKNGNGTLRIIDNTNSVDRLNINSTGQVLIGTTSSLYSSTQKDGLQIEGAGGGPFVIVSKNIDTSGGANQILFQDGSGDTCGEIASNATNNTTSYGTSSDYRLKENITDVTNAISTLKKLKPRTYNFISDPDNISEDGFLAHELGAVVPNAVTGEKDAMTSDNEIKPQQVDYGRLTPLLTAALQEAIAKIETLEAEVKTLKGE